MKHARKNDQPLPKIWRNNLFLLRIAFQEAPYYAFHQLMSVAKNRAIVFVEHIYMIGFVINAIMDQRPFREVALFIGTVFIVITLWVNVWDNIVSARIEPVAKQKIDKRLRMELYAKAANIDLKCYDDPEFFNDFVWAMGEASTRLHKVLQTAADFVGHIVSVCIVGGYILTQDPLGLVFVLISFLGIILVAARQNRLRLDLNERMKPLERKRDYVSRVLYLADYAKEIRLNRIKGKLYKAFGEAADGLDRETRRGTWAISACAFCIHFVFDTLMMDGLYLITLLYRTIVRHTFQYGTMVTLYNSCGQIRRSLLDLSRTIPEFLEHSLYIDKIRRFLDYEITVASPAQPEPLPREGADFELRNVSFAYGDTTVLHNIDLTIRRGEKIALVGYNGAGKTTLVKLLMRLYDVSGGEIRYGGRDIRRYALKDYRSTFETVFQDYQLFAATVRENVVMDEQPLDPDRAQSAARQSGFLHKLGSLPQGYETQVTKEFDTAGALLSGGEAQSLVIMRALYKDSPVMILDEPSSALDPIAEYNLNQTMFALSGDKTVITISHRLSTTKNADRIYMLEKGRIIEQGTHDELMRLNGKYAEMFNMQREKYAIA